jgi:hypothetical protein
VDLIRVGLKKLEVDFYRWIYLEADLLRGHLYLGADYSCG